MKLLDRLRARWGNQKLRQMQHDGRQYLLPSVLLPATKIDYAKKVGDGLGSSVLAAPLNWIMRNFPQAPPVVEQLENQEWVLRPDHPLAQLLRQPNEFYGGRELWMATVLDFCFGNAYWIKVRDGLGRVRELWWVPAHTMLPRWDPKGKEFISYYEYRPGGVGNRALGVIDGMTVVQSSNGSSSITLEVRDVVHFRFGLDPRNPRLGLSPLGALMREVYTDDEAANFASVILQNYGIVGIVISPKEKGVASPEDIKAVKEYLLEHFTGDKRGQPLALAQPTDVNLLQYNLQSFDMSPLRDVSEERVCAALGIPAAVVGFGTGLQTTKVGATMREMRRMAWTDGVIPLQDAIAEQLSRQLLPEFEDDETVAKMRIRFDLSKVPALEEEKNEKHNRVRADYVAGIIPRSTAKRELGYAVAADGSDDVYAQPMNLALLREGEIPVSQTAGGGLPPEE